VAPHPIMPIDSFTVLLFGLFIKIVPGVLFLVFWLQTRSAPWFGWWSASLLLGSCTSALYMWRGPDSLLSVGVGNAMLLASFACCWQGARSFDRRPPLWSPVLVIPPLWLAVCFVPDFLASVPHRVILSSSMIAPLLAMAAFEFWRGRAEQLPSRWPVIATFGLFALLFAARIPLVGVAPFPFGALPIQPGWLGAFNLAMFAHTMLLSVLLVSLSKERLELDQRTKAQTDPLTGALNRRAFMSRGARLLQRHAKERAPLCLLFLDLDHFKSFNDRFGHSGGDDVLTSFVDLVNACIRPTDFLFRIGGEEFCCLLPHTTAEQAHRVAERIRHQFEITMIEVAGTAVKATTSLGIASTDTFGYDLDRLMRRADLAVYAAKRAGRNCVMVATEGEVDDAAAARLSRGVGTAA
jgi:diguanylate cyclase (GGDEF)-like protein